MDHLPSREFQYWACVTGMMPTFGQQWWLWYDLDQGIAQQRTGAKHRVRWL
ncbi:MAG: hypothetical protein KDB01_14255 [Planctomycetaceae bacterium]|nr:hypothetical protein [Planctomycetaceae bacterium]